MDEKFVRITELDGEPEPDQDESVPPPFNSAWRCFHENTERSDPRNKTETALYAGLRDLASGLRDMSDRLSKIEDVVKRIDSQTKG